jgi:hypothetical protein
LCMKPWAHASGRSLPFKARKMQQWVMNGAMTLQKADKSE